MTGTDATSAMQEGHEETVISFLMVHPERIPEFAGTIGPELFTHPKNRLVLDTFGDLLAQGTKISLISVSDALRKSGKLEQAGGDPYLTHLFVDYWFGEAAFGYALGELRSSAGKRAVAEIGRRMLAGELSPKDAISALALIETHDLGASSLTIRSAEEIRAAKLDEHDCLMGDRLLAKGQALDLIGAGGLGKSRLLLQLAAASIIGRSWCGFETHAQGLKWLVFQTENSTRRLKTDLDALADWCAHQWDQVAGRLFIHTLETDLDGVLMLSEPRAVRGIEAAIRTHNPDIIGFDPLRDVMIGDPNNDADMSATLAAIGSICRRGNPHRAIILLHHALTGKAGAAKATGYDRASYGRNSKVLHGWTRAQVNVAPGCRDNNESLVLTCGKNSNGKEFAPVAIRLNPATMIYEPDELFDLEGWSAEITGNGKGKSQRPMYKPEVVRDAFEASGLKELTKAALVRAICSETGCARSRAYELVEEALKQKMVRRDRASSSYSLA